MIRWALWLRRGFSVNKRTKNPHSHGVYIPLDKVTIKQYDLVSSAARRKKREWV